ncbi:MAG: lysylphosphatidylglycerol synthase domain-containing protein [Bacteroidota bacterium]
MQSNDFILKDDARKLATELFRIVATIASIGFIWMKIKDSNLDLSLIAAFDTANFLIILLVALLVVPNWLLESWRWTEIISVIDPLKWTDSLKEVMVGIMLNMAVPFGIGDLIARLSKRKDRRAALSTIVFSRSIMTSITIMLGCFGISKYLEVSDPILILLLTTIAALALSIYGLGRFHGRTFLFFQRASFHQIVKILCISVIRYATYVIQFVVILQLFVHQIPVDELIGGIGIIYLSKTFIPSFFNGLGIREITGILYFEKFIDNASIIILPILIIWVINTVLPAFVGGIILWRSKFD